MSNVPERRKGLRRLLVDTDTAADDPVALVMALRHPGVRVEASPSWPATFQLTGVSRTPSTPWSCSRRLSRVPRGPLLLWFFEDHMAPTHILDWMKGSSE
jgi:hypothetical protein